MPINPRVFGPPTARVQSTGLERLGGPNRPEFGGDISTERLADEAAAFSAMQALPTFKRAGTDDIEPPEFDFDLDDEPIETPRGLRDPQASETPRAGLERLSRDEGPSDLNTAFGLAGTATGTAKRIAQGFDQLAPTTVSSSEIFEGAPAGPPVYDRPRASAPPPVALSPPSEAPLLDLDDLGGGTVDTGSGARGGGFDVAGGLMRIGEALTSDRSGASKGLGTVAGGLQAYQGASQLSGGALPPVPYAAPISAGLSAASGGANAENPEMGAARGVMDLLRGGLSSLGPGGFGAATLFAPAFESIGSSIYDAFHEPSHEERETLEANKAIAAAKGMARDVQFATTPEELQAVIDRYGGGFAGQMIGADNWDPMAFEASIRAGVDPSFLTDANTRLSEIVRQQAQALALAEQGHPEALAYLDRQRQAQQAFQDELLQLMDPERVGFARGGPGAADPYTEALTHLAYADNDLELVRERAHVPPPTPQQVDPNAGEIPQPIATLIEAGILPAMSRVPDTQTEYFGLPRGTQVPVEEYRRLLDWYSSGGA